MSWYRSISFLRRVFLSISLPFWSRFSRSSNQGEKQSNAQKCSTITERTHRCRHADELCHTPLSLLYATYGNVTTSQEMFANVRTCGYHGPRPHVHSVQLCRGPPANRVPPSASTPSRETNCERYWLPRQICAVQRVNKMDGVVRLSSGKGFLTACLRACTTQSRLTEAYIEQWGSAVPQLWLWTERQGMKGVLLPLIVCKKKESVIFTVERFDLICPVLSLRFLLLLKCPDWYFKSHTQSIDKWHYRNISLQKYCPYYSGIHFTEVICEHRLDGRKKNVPLFLCGAFARSCVVSHVLCSC